MPKNEFTPNQQEVESLIFQIQRRNPSVGNILKEMSNTARISKQFVTNLRELSLPDRQIRFLGDSQYGQIARATTRVDIMAADARDCCMLMTDYISLAHLPINYNDFITRPGKLNDHLIQIKPEEQVYFFPGTSWTQPQVSHITQWWMSHLGKSELTVTVMPPEDYRIWLHSTPQGNIMYVHKRNVNEVKMTGYLPTPSSAAAKTAAR